MNLSAILDRRKPNRRVVGMAALLLPFERDGSIDGESYQACMEETYLAGLTPAVNMDTGYVNLLTEPEKLHVLELAREVAKGRPFVGGAFIEGKDGDPVDLYRQEMERIVRFGGIPILFQTSRLHTLDSRGKAAVYAAASRGFDRVYAFELGRMFAPNGEIWDEETFERVLQIPEVVGAKHSSLSRQIELNRLEARDRVRPDFQILTGNDLGIDVIEYGSDYLLGLAAFAPALFRERDRLWEAGDGAYLELADALQFLGNVAFRTPVPAYKHSAAVYLNLTGRIPTDQTHPNSHRRPPWERDILAACAARLNRRAE